MFLFSLNIRQSYPFIHKKEVSSSLYELNGLKYAFLKKKKSYSNCCWYNRGCSIENF